MNQDLLSTSTGPACSIRLAAPGDCDRIARLSGQLGYECTDQQVQARLVDMHNSGQHTVFVAELPGERIAGWIGVYIFRSVGMDPFAEISGLVVDEMVRSRGIGAMLLDAAEEWARGMGCSVMSVRSNVIRGRAHAFYESRAFRLVKEQKVFRKSL
ncbi:MAG TPA: GNAT family N-acetyltransferase [Terriglobales bacterium]